MIHTYLCARFKPESSMPKVVYYLKVGCRFGEVLEILSFPLVDGAVCTDKGNKIGREHCSHIDDAFLNDKVVQAL